MTDTDTRVNSEKGGLYFLSTDVKLSVNTCGLSAAACAQLNRDIQAEVVQLEQDIEDYEYWPVVNLSLHYRF